MPDQRDAAREKAWEARGHEPDIEGSPWAPTAAFRTEFDAGWNAALAVVGERPRGIVVEVVEMRDMRQGDVFWNGRGWENVLTNPTPFRPAWAGEDLLRIETDGGAGNCASFKPDEPVLRRVSVGEREAPREEDGRDSDDECVCGHTRRWHGADEWACEHNGECFCSMFEDIHDPRCSGECGPCGGVGGVPDTGPNGEMAMTCLTCGGDGKCHGCSTAWRLKREREAKGAAEARVQALTEAARWVIANWDRGATQHGSMKALREAVLREASADD